MSGRDVSRNEGVRSVNEGDYSVNERVRSLNECYFSAKLCFAVVAKLFCGYAAASQFDEDGGRAAGIWVRLTEKQSFSANRAAQPQMSILVILTAPPFDERKRLCPSV